MRKKHQDLLFVPFLAFLYQENLRFYKVIAQTVFIPATTAFIYLLIFGVSLGGNIQIGEGISYLEFLIPGLVMMGCMNNSYQNSSSSLLSYKYSGDIITLKASPISAQQLIWAISFGGLMRGCFVGAIQFFIGEIFYFVYMGKWLIPHNVFVLLLFLVIGGIAFAKLGMVVAFFGRNFDQISAFGGFIVMPLIYLGGVFFSLDSLSPFWIAVSRFNPLLYFINGVRYGILGVSDVPIFTAFIISLIGFVLFHLIAIVAIKKGSFQSW